MARILTAPAFAVLAVASGLPGPCGKGLVMVNHRYDRLGYLTCECETDARECLDAHTCEINSLCKKKGIFPAALEPADIVDNLYAHSGNTKAYVALHELVLEARGALGGHGTSDDSHALERLLWKAVEKAQKSRGQMTEQRPEKSLGNSNGLRYLRDAVALASDLILSQLERVLDRAAREWSEQMLASYMQARADFRSVFHEARYGSEMDDLAGWLNATTHPRYDAPTTQAVPSSFAPVRSVLRVDRVDKMSAKKFRSQYQSKVPVVLTSWASAWPAQTKWTLDYLRAKVGDASVGAAFQDTSEGWVNQIKRFDSEFRACTNWENQTNTRALDDLVGSWALVRPPKQQIRVRDALTHFESGRGDIPIYLNEVPIYEGLEPLLADLGALDIHSSSTSDELPARDLFMTNAPAIIGLHYDYEDNLFTVVQGSKEVILFPPSQHRRLYNKPMVNIQPTFSKQERMNKCSFIATSVLNTNHCEINELHPDVYGEHKSYADAEDGTVVTLRKGEMLYIPANWFHAVRTLPDAGGYALAVNAWLQPVKAQRGKLSKSEL